MLNKYPNKLNSSTNNIFDRQKSQINSASHRQNKIINNNRNNFIEELEKLSYCGVEIIINSFCYQDINKGFFDRKNNKRVAYASASYLSKKIKKPNGGYYSKRTIENTRTALFKNILCKQQLGGKNRSASTSVSKDWLCSLQSFINEGVYFLNRNLKKLIKFFIKKGVLKRVDNLVPEGMEGGMKRGDVYIDNTANTLNINLINQENFLKEKRKEETEDVSHAKNLYSDVLTVVEGIKDACLTKKTAAYLRHAYLKIFGGDRERWLYFLKKANNVANWMKTKEWFCLRWLIKFETIKKITEGIYFIKPIPLSCLGSSVVKELTTFKNNQKIDTQEKIEMMNIKLLTHSERLDAANCFAGILSSLTNPLSTNLL